MRFVGRVILDQRPSRRKEVLNDPLVSLQRVFFLHRAVDLEPEPQVILHAVFLIEPDVLHLELVLHAVRDEDLGELVHPFLDTVHLCRREGADHCLQLEGHGLKEENQLIFLLISRFQAD